MGEGEGEDCWAGLTVMRLIGIGKRVRAWERTGADSDKTVHFRKEGEGEGEDCGLTVMRLYCIL